MGASSARKVLKLLTYFTPDRTHARVEDLAAHVDVPKSTAYRHLALLKETGLIASGADGRWHLAPALIRLGEAARSAVGIIELALPAMQRLSHQTQETVLLIERIGDAGVCVAKQDAPQMIRLSFEVGTGCPCTAAQAPSCCWPIFHWRSSSSIGRMPRPTTRT